MPFSQSQFVPFRIKDMQSRYTVHIASAEWRWVVLVGCGLVLLAFLPSWVALLGQRLALWALHNYLDGELISKVTWA
jgi:hypothetical protein